MDQTNNTPAHSGSEGTEHKHTSPRIVFAVLIVLTVIEIATAFIGTLPRGFTFPFLLSLSLVKFALVALYYMHLRYEKPLYGFIFVMPAIFGLLLISILMA